ncbi:MAG TPA: ParB/RepB/Spo0J family partition protein [Caulobacteraceae bacterium]|nr:ParB/RepB/Spo0J family partition protein [Caulobacteraceae bacterium]
MAEVRRGLGRGLAALLDEAGGFEVGRAAGEGAPGVTEVAIEHVDPNPAQPRSSFPEGELEALATSIRDKGVIQPILVRPGASGRFQIVAGERRWRAAQKAGRTSIPAIVRALSDEQAMEIALVENVQRADLNPLEEARAYAALARDFARSQESIARAVGKSRSHIANTMRLLRLPPSIQADLEAGRLTSGHARALLELDDPVKAAAHVVTTGLNVRQTEALARRMRRGSTGRGAPEASARDPDTRDLETSLGDMLGLRVEIRHAGAGGQLRIDYATLEQLDDLCRRLTRAA